jgi:hypothetical protein
MTTYMWDEVPKNVTSNTSKVSSLVVDKFETAIDYAEDAWNALTTYVSGINNIQYNRGTWTPITIDDIATELLINIQSTRPVVTDFTSYFASLSSVVLPNFPTLQIPPSVSINDTADSLKSAVLTKLVALVNTGGTGLNATVEAEIWARFLQRKETENAKLYLDAENYFSARGFDLPPGALSGRLNEISVEIARTNGIANNDITIEQAQLAQKNTQFYLDTGWKSAVGILAEEATRLVMYNKSLVDEYIAKVEGVKIEVTKYVSIIEAITKRIGAEVELYKADITLAGIEVDADYKTAELKVRLAIADAEVKIKEMGLSIEEAKGLLALQLENTKAAVSVLGQVCASALTSVNASAALGLSTSVNEGANVSGQNIESNSNSTSTSYQYQISRSESV